MKIPILMYHNVIDTKSNYKKNIELLNPAYHISKEKFRSQMTWLYEHGFESITLGRILELKQYKGNNKNIGKQNVVITFDDGWSGVYDYAFPILKELGFNAVFFIATGKVGTEGFIDWDNLTEMVANGIEIGSHGVSHKPLREMSERERNFELRESKKILEKLLGIKVNFLSLPHGLFDAKLLAQARKHGYSGVCSSEAGVMDMNDKFFLMKRINISGKISINEFKRIVNVEFIEMKKLLLIDWLKKGLKRIVGYKFYRWAYEVMYR